MKPDRTDPMTAKPLTLALAALMAATPITGALAAEVAAMDVVAPAQAVAEAPARKPLFAFLAPKTAEEKAALRAERQAARDEKKLARGSNHAQSASAGEAARAEVKEAVAVAVANRPKGRLWCVPFARAVSGVEIRGNARTWWEQAKGLYARGQEPQVGAVMAFAASRAMPKGHVAVVSKVVSEREILVDQANWVKNRVTQDTLVVDVSAQGDWSAVKVANANGTLGRVNPINGFIYN